MYQVTYSNKFKKALKKCERRSLDISKIEYVIKILALTGKVPSEYRPHKLSGKYDNAWECHIEPDWLLIWQQDDHELILLMLDTGTHSDIF